MIGYMMSALTTLLEELSGIGRIACRDALTQAALHQGSASKGARLSMAMIMTPLFDRRA